MTLIVLLNRSKALFSHTCVSTNSESWQQALRTRTRMVVVEGGEPSLRRKRALEMRVGKVVKDDCTPCSWLPSLNEALSLGPAQLLTQAGGRKTTLNGSTTFYGALGIVKMVFMYIISPDLYSNPLERQLWFMYFSDVKTRLREDLPKFTHPETWEKWHRSPCVLSVKILSSN